MAPVVSRLYGSFTPPDLLPAFSSLWDLSSTTVQRFVVERGHESPDDNEASYDAYPSGTDVVMFQMVTPPLPTQFCSGVTFKGQMIAIEFDAADNARSQCVVRTIRTNGTEKQVLLGLDEGGLANEWNDVSFQNRRVRRAGAVVLPDFQLADNERICIEVGARLHGASPVGGHVRWHGAFPDGPDLPEDETTLDGSFNNWVEFSALEWDFFQAPPETTETWSDLLREAKAPEDNQDWSEIIRVL